eukprot:COSAG01_NODE_12019_length_1815_cov_32.250000_1_plen_383_part_10
MVEGGASHLVLPAVTEGSVQHRLDAYNTIPVVSTLLFGTALTVVLMLDHKLLEGCDPERTTGSSGSGMPCELEEVAVPSAVKHLSTAPMHMAVGLNLFATMVETTVYYFAKRLLGHETGAGDYIKRADTFLNEARLLRTAAFYAFLASVPCFGVGLIFTLHVLLPSSAVASVGTVIYSLSIIGAMSGTWSLWNNASRQWTSLVPEDEAELKALREELRGEDGRGSYVAVSRSDDAQEREPMLPAMAEASEEPLGDNTLSEQMAQLERKEREIILEAVAQDGDTLEYADASLKKDREFMLAAVAQNGYALYHADASLKKDREFMLAAVAQNGYALEYADASLKKDREVVLAVVAQDGDALGHADASLKKDREVVLAAVAQNGFA